VNWCSAANAPTSVTVKKGLFLATIGLFAAQALPCLAADVELLSCVHVKSSDKEHPVVDPKAHADLALAGARVLSRVVTPGTDKPVTFKGCKPTDGVGNFQRWFGTVCQSMQSLDGGALSMDYYIAGAYAGISRRLSPKDSMWNMLKDASGKLGIPVPDRTFVIYAEKSPIFEFFCSKNPRLAASSPHADRFDSDLKILLNGGELPPEAPPEKGNDRYKDLLKNWPRHDNPQTPSQSTTPQKNAV